ncbi:MAG: hypothetical protein ABUM51_07950 [Bacteroidota bacterium]
MSRDHRYDLIRSLYDRGKIVAFNDIFKYVPKTIVANDLGKKVDRFNKLISKVGGFTLDELALIGKFCDLEDAIIFELAINEYTQQKKNKPQNPK